MQLPAEINDLLVPVGYGTKSGGPGDERVAHLIADNLTIEPRIGIVGFPVDQGVLRNGGRPGAAGAPSKIRSFLGRLSPDARNHAASANSIRSVRDLGDVVPAESLEESQNRLGRVVEYLLARNVIPVILGGGHETAFGHFLGYQRQNTPPAIINIDAHPDVRPYEIGLGHSGSPFRQALESDPSAQAYSVLGLQPHSVARSHVEFLDANNCRYFWCAEFTADLFSQVLSDSGSPVMLTLDMDAVDQSAAPGVSAPSTGGLESSRLLEIAYDAGRSPKVQSIDLVEVNPEFDIDNRTARLAALVIWQFLRGFADRSL